MAVEIERKFLLANDAWRDRVKDRELLRDGLLSASPSGKLRVRIYGDRATLALKSEAQGLVRSEYEYIIPQADAEEMLAQHCAGNVLEKIRHYVDYQGFTWEIDEYQGALAGVIVAEIELEASDVEVPLPPWIGAEITGDPRYSKVNLIALLRGQPLRHVRAPMAPRSTS